MRQNVKKHNLTFAFYTVLEEHLLYLLENHCEFLKTFANSVINTTALLSTNNLSYSNSIFQSLLYIFLIYLGMRTSRKNVRLNYIYALRFCFFVLSKQWITEWFIYPIYDITVVFFCFYPWMNFIFRS